MNEQATHAVTSGRSAGVLPGPASFDAFERRKALSAVVRALRRTRTLREDVLTALSAVARVVALRSAVVVRRTAAGRLHAWCALRPPTVSRERALLQGALANATRPPVPLGRETTIEGAVTFRPTGDAASPFATLEVEMAAGTPADLRFLQHVTDAVADSVRRRDARRRADRRQPSYDEVLRSVAHDLKNPLATISLATSSLLRRRLRDEDRADAAAELAIIQRAAARAHALVGDLLDEARLRAGVLQLDVVRCCIDDVLQDAADLLRPLATAKGVTLDAALARGLPEVEADPHRVHQIVANLLGNAIKFTPARGHVELVGVVRHREVEIGVFDSGVGIPPEHLATIFEPFVRAHARTHPGTGLGLSIARGLVRAQHGDLHVASTPGRGSTFSFTLPIAPGPGPLPAEGDRGKAKGFEQRRVRSLA